jgi:hypothetical protein
MWATEEGMTEVRVERPLRPLSYEAFMKWATETGEA